MGLKMPPSEQEQLIQRYYDGETIGRESELVEEMLRSDPRAQEILDKLVSLSDSIKIDLDPDLDFDLDLDHDQDQYRY